MSKASQVILLAEDQRQQRFAYSFLKELGYGPRDVRRLPLPAGRQAGEQWVRVNYGKEVNGFRTRSARVRTLLLVVIDADNRTVANRAQQLHQALIVNGLLPRDPNEGIAHFIPKWSIETWVLALDGDVVDENHSYRGNKTVDPRLSASVVAFHAGTISKNAPANWLPSLRSAHEEARRLR